MRSLSSLKKELDSLPLGNVYRKVIKGNEYWYHQYFFAGKRYSRLLDSSEVEVFQRQISRRKELEQEWKAATAGKDVTLSSSAKEFTGSLMSGDVEVARFEHGNMVFLDEQRAPLLLLRSGDLPTFLSSRAIDSSRTNARLLKKTLHIQENDDALVSLHAYGASISDDYWFKPKHSKLRYKDICFQSDAFADLALKGEIALYPRKGRLTPEITTVGSFEKGWKRVDGRWTLYKKATRNEAFSECFCAYLASLFFVPSVLYFYEEGLVFSPNFAEEANFEPMMAIAGNDDSYLRVYRSLQPFGPSLQDAYLRLVYFDAVINNVDRHNENCGLMRSRTDGKVLSLAPSFDCNLALISRQDHLNGNPAKDGFIKLFLDFAMQEEPKRAYKALGLPSINEDSLRVCLQKTPQEIWPKDVEELLEALVLRNDYLKTKIEG